MRGQGPLRAVPPPRTQQVLSSGVLGTLIFIVAEAMMFAGLISAFVIVKAGNVGSWPPPGQPRLPAEETLVNSLALLISGFVLYHAHRLFENDRPSALRPLGIAIGLGAFFVGFQGYEWVRLIGQGLTLTSSPHGSFFYLIVGMHGLHALGALLALAVVWLRLRRGLIASSTFHAAALFWAFVVGLWPILYTLVYL